MIERLMERYILEGKITREEVDAMIAERAEQAPAAVLSAQVSKENDMLRAQVDATNSYMDFLEEVIVEMAMVAYE